MVKKILADGSACRKCADVMAKLEQSGHIECIDEIVVADENNPDSAGMKLAREYEVDRAPFFIVQEDNCAAKIYTIYYKLVLEVLDA